MEEKIKLLRFNIIYDLMKLNDIQVSQYGKNFKIDTLLNKELENINRALSKVILNQFMLSINNKSALQEVKHD